MNTIYWAIIGLGVFVAIWMLFVVPSERRHHERKLELIQKQLEQRKAQAGRADDNAPDDLKDDKERS